MTAAGQLCTIAFGEAGLPCVQRRAGKITAAAAMPWLGQTRILLATDDGPIVCLAPEDELVTQYASAYSALRIVTAGADRIAAVTSDRQRIVPVESVGWAQACGRGACGRGDEAPHRGCGVYVMGCGNL